MLFIYKWCCENVYDAEKTGGDSCLLSYPVKHLWNRSEQLLHSSNNINCCINTDGLFIHPTTSSIIWTHMKTCGCSQIRKSGYRQQCKWVRPQGPWSHLWVKLPKNYDRAAPSVAWTRHRQWWMTSAVYVCRYIAFAVTAQRLWHACFTCSYKQTDCWINYLYFSFLTNDNFNLLAVQWITAVLRCTDTHSNMLCPFTNSLYTCF